MTADRLLRLYPRAWRDRYAGEFLETAGNEALSLQQVIDITMGAIDAWVSSDVRRSTENKSAVTPNQAGGTMTAGMVRALCRGSKLRMTTKDGVISALVLLGTSIVLAGLGIWLNRAGFHLAGEVMKGMAFPVSVLVSMPFGVMKGQPWRAQAVVLGVTLPILVAISVLAARL